MYKKRKVTLGQKVFILSGGSEVVCTMVGRITDTDYYTLLNGWDSSTPHWFTYEEALIAAEESVQAHIVALRKRATMARKKLKQLATDASKQATMKAPYKVVDLRSDPRERTRKLMKVLIPHAYPKPGAMVYIVITPKVGRREFEYRPFPHFVLETKVSSVCFSPDGKVHISFATPFKVDEHFTTRKEAETKLRCFKERDALEPIHFVSHATEKMELDKIEDIPF